MLVPPQALLIRCLRSLVSTAALASLLAGSPLGAEEQPPSLLPTRGVDISYRITQSDQPKIVQRRRWSASDRLVRSEGPDEINHALRPGRARDNDHQSEKSHLSQVGGLRCASRWTRKRVSH